MALALPKRKKRDSFLFGRVARVFRLAITSVLLMHRAVDHEQLAIYTSANRLFAQNGLQNARGLVEQFCVRHESASEAFLGLAFFPLQRGNSLPFFEKIPL